MEYHIIRGRIIEPFGLAGWSTLLKLPLQDASVLFDSLSAVLDPRLHNDTEIASLIRKLQIF